MYWMTGILGFVLLIAPYIFGYADNTAALWISVIGGLFVGAVSIIEGIRKDTQNWEYWTAGVIGLFAVFAPLIFGFSTYATAMWSSVIIGALIAIIAGTRLLTGHTGR